MFGIFQCLLLRIHGETSELLGSCPWKRKLKPEAIPTIFPHKPARSVHVVTFGFLYTSGVPYHCVCVATSCVLTNLLSLSLVGASTTRSAGRSRWFAGKFRGNSLRFKFLFPRARSKKLILKSHRVFEAISIQMLRTQ